MSHLRIVYTALNVALFISILFIGITASQPSYDPWLDNTDDGYGGIDDIVATAEHFGASGDPAKLCNITNWPMGTQVPVFYAREITNGGSVGSAWCPTNGFKYMVLLIRADGLTTGEEVEITMSSRIYNDDHTLMAGINVWSITLTSTMSEYNTVLFVPGEQVGFGADALGSTTCIVYASFYLTW
ncbi:MAG: hypothetical protein JSV05_08860 [Candidatus Bathyarchaeota archaeon]|nr:MAG: hypothetical protein JSV05_08860 [Candidatus Bathyarchaeota archaeon]